MKIKSGSYNVPHITIDTAGITAGTPAVVGNKRDFLRLASIVKESGNAIIDYIKVGDVVLKGTVNIIRYTGDGNDGFDFGTVTNYEQTPMAVTGTLAVDGDDVKLTILLTEIPTEEER